MRARARDAYDKIHWRNDKYKWQWLGRRTNEQDISLFYERKCLRVNCILLSPTWIAKKRKKAATNTKFHIIFGATQSVSAITSKSRRMKSLTNDLKCSSLISFHPLIQWCSPSSLCALSPSSIQLDHFEFFFMFFCALHFFRLFFIVFLFFFFSFSVSQIIISVFVTCILNDSSAYLLILRLKFTISQYFMFYAPEMR